MQQVVLHAMRPSDDKLALIMSADSLSCATIYVLAQLFTVIYTGLNAHFNSFFADHCSLGLFLVGDHQSDMGYYPAASNLCTM